MIHCLGVLSFVCPCLRFEADGPPTRVTGGTQGVAHGTPQGSVVTFPSGVTCVRDSPSARASAASRYGNWSPGRSSSPFGRGSSNGTARPFGAESQRSSQLPRMRTAGTAIGSTAQYSGATRSAIASECVRLGEEPAETRIVTVRSPSSGLPSGQVSRPPPYTCPRASPIQDGVDVPSAVRTRRLRDVVLASFGVVERGALFG